MRKELKKKAKARVRKCYGMFVFLCLLLAILSIDYQDDLSILKTGINLTQPEQVIKATNTGIGFWDSFAEIASGNADELNKLSEKNIESKKGVSKKVAIVSVEYTRGVAANMVNNVSSGRIMSRLYQAIKSISHSKKVAMVIYIVLALILAIFVRIFIVDLVYVSVKRFYMESRIYDHVPMKRFLFYIQMGKGFNVVKTILLQDIYQVLWSFTIIGGAIKYYSYRLVPYIIAENPSMGANEAITLSRKMMKGHKWEAFVLDLSFILWRLLNWCTFGILGILFLNPYIEATDSEYYAHLRELAKANNVPNVDKLNDIYLYDKAPKEVLEEAYSEVKDLEEPEVYEPRKGFLGFVENVFGITLVIDEKAKEYERISGKNFNLKGFRAILNGKMYPRRLFTIKGEDVKFKEVSPLNFDRRYSILSLIFIFFTMCIIGWLWEVSLHLIADGEFVNRGVLHGPWLPIYGAGGVMILVILNKFRKHPVVELVTAIVLCGLVEYFTAYYLEMTHGGTKWWDYSGYFLNVHGRICAEGLLVFGLGGMAIVYFVAPFLDNMFRHIPVKIMAPIAAVLLAVYIGDTIYSHDHPNMGKGITNYGSEEIKKDAEVDNVSSLYNIDCISVVARTSLPKKGQGA